jgi:hypothetical protein
MSEPLIKKSTLRKKPVAAFGPEMMAALIRGSRETLQVSIPTYRAAVRFQQRLQMLRGAMRAEKHNLATVVARTRISIKWGREAGLPDVETRYTNQNNAVPADRNTPCVVTLSPQDSEFREAIVKAGISESDIVADDPFKDLFAEFDKTGDIQPPQSPSKSLTPQEEPVESSAWLDGIMSRGRK